MHYIDTLCCIYIYALCVYVCLRVCVCVCACDGVKVDCVGPQDVYLYVWLHGKHNVNQRNDVEYRLSSPAILLPACNP